LEQQNEKMSRLTKATFKGNELYGISSLLPNELNGLSDKFQK